MCVFCLAAGAYAQDRGACCLPDGTCIDTDDQTCARMGGRFFLNQTCADVDCGEPGHCNGNEYLRVSCASRSCGVLVKAVLYQATPGTQHTICLDGMQCITKTVNARGKIVVKWCPVREGSHVVTTECDLPWEFDTQTCGNNDRCRYHITAIKYHNNYTSCAYNVGDVYWTDDKCDDVMDCDLNKYSLIKDSQGMNKCCATFARTGCNAPKKRFTPIAACP